MGRKITFNLLLMGIIGALLAVMMTAFTFQGRVVSRIEDTLRTSGNTMRMVYNSTLRYASMEHYLLEGYYLQVIAPNGMPVYDSRDVFTAGSADDYLLYLYTQENYDPEEMIHRPEVEEALQKGTGLYRDVSASVGMDIYRYAARLANGNILLVYTGESSLLTWYIRTLPNLLVVFVFILGISALLSVWVTKRLVAPINHLSGQINSGTLDFNTKNVYPELVPFISEIYIQRLRNNRRISQLAEEKNKLAAIMKDMSEGIIVFDRSRRILMANDKAQMFFGFHPDLESDRPYYLTKNSPLNSCVDIAMRGHSKTSVAEIGGRQLQLTADPIFSDEKQTGIICSVRDITEQMAVEKMKQEFSANVSHELKTPLASISGYAEMIETGIAQAGDVQNFAHIIRKESGRLLSLINDIIKLSQLDESESLEAEEVDLLQLAEETCDVLTLRASRKQITLHSTGTPLVITGARELLQELIYNLVDNAIKYNHTGGKVTVEVKGHTLRVVDNGLGIPDSAKPHLFERFFRVEKSRSKEMGGTGLGLAIVKHIADLHGARMLVEDTPGGGATFLVVFPKTPPKTLQ